MRESGFESYLQVKIMASDRMVGHSSNSNLAESSTAALAVLGLAIHTKTQKFERVILAVGQRVGTLLGEVGVVIGRVSGRARFTFVVRVTSVLEVQLRVLGA